MVKPDAGDTIDVAVKYQMSKDPHTWINSLFDHDVVKLPIKLAYYSPSNHLECNNPAKNISLMVNTLP
ncbi:MAG: hypothetical protein ACKPKO_12475, partial [Candidatus Fonsibacter sp.]